MYYIDHVDSKTGMLAVADTNDNGMEYISRQDYNDYLANGVDIQDWNTVRHSISGVMNRNCNYKLYRKINRGVSSSELLEFLKSFSVYMIVDRCSKNNLEIDYSSDCKLLNYSETLGFYLVVLDLTNNSGKLVLSVNSEGYCFVDIISEPCVFKYYPACVGSLVLRLTASQGLDLSSINSEELYLVLYSLDLGTLLLYGVMSHTCFKFKVNAVLGGH